MSDWRPRAYRAPDGASCTLFHLELRAPTSHPHMRPWRVVLYPESGQHVYWRQCPCGLGVSYDSLLAAHMGAAPQRRMAVPRQVRPDYHSRTLARGELDPAVFIAAFSVVMHKPFNPWLGAIRARKKGDE